MAFWLPLLKILASGAAKTGTVAGKIGSTALAETGGVTGMLGKAGQAGLGMGKGTGFLQKWGGLMNIPGMGTTGTGMAENLTGLNLESGAGARSPLGAIKEYGRSSATGLGRLLGGVGLYAQNQEERRPAGDILRRIVADLQMKSGGRF